MHVEGDEDLEFLRDGANPLWSGVCGGVGGGRDVGLVPVGGGGGGGCADEGVEGDWGWVVWVRGVDDEVLGVSLAEGKGTGRSHTSDGILGAILCVAPIDSPAIPDAVLLQGLVCPSGEGDIKLLEVKPRGDQPSAGGRRPLSPNLGLSAQHSPENRE